MDNGININEHGLMVNPDGINFEDFAVPAAKTQAPDVTSSTDYFEPVQFDTGCFGNPNAFDRLQELLHQREVTNTVAEPESVAEDTFAAMPQDAGIEPAFC